VRWRRISIKSEERDRSDDVAHDEGILVTELTCKELVELVTEYLEGTLPVAERRRFDKHIAGCGACTNYLEQIRQTIQSCARLTEEAIPKEARQELLGLFRDWKKSGQNLP
jgi:anti-sigma factor RsiW